jgi:short-subunit dehydrogenase
MSPSSGPVAVIGASGVLGSAVAEDLFGRGYSLALTGRNEQRLFGTSQACGGAPAWALDIRDPHQVVATIHAMHQQLGGLAGLVITTGVVTFGTIAQSSDAAAEEVTLTNLLGPLSVIRAALPALVTSQGWVCAVTGVVAERPMPGMAAYSASKSALSAALTALRTEVRRDKVTVIDARPPHTETGLASRSIEGDAPSLPAGLLPQHVARIIVDAIVQRIDVVPSSAFAEVAS